MAEFIFVFIPIFALATLLLKLIVYGLHPDKSKEEGNEAFYLMILLTMFISAVISAYFTTEPWKVESEAAIYGQMGDFFGGMLNPVLAFASFIALLHTIRIQSKQIANSQSEQQAAAFEQTFSQMVEALRSTPRANMERVRLINGFSVSYQGKVSLERQSLDFRNHYNSNERSWVDLASMFYECVDLLHSHQATKPAHWTILANMLSSIETYVVISLIGDKQVNFLGSDVLVKIADQHRLFRRAVLISNGQYLSIGHGDTRVDGSWKSLYIEDFGLNISAFKHSEA